MAYTKMALYFKDKNTKVELKKIIAEYKNSEEAIKAIIEIYTAFKSKPKFI